ncbi:MAG: diaminopimelate decarboxylase [Thermoguttaceae bacterium]|nr:diaminopimelate decarboxylase [Thermoguttaceae bacterium]MDW8038717.1 diaminopimelate decarboxylase [Thermoguttaceae bacterium]
MLIRPPFALLRTEIAGIPVVQLVQQFGTPVFVYDAAWIVRRLEDLRHFDCVRYAMKACSNLAVLNLLRRHGALVDCVSAGEVRRALYVGYPAQGDPPPIVYTADIFDRESLQLVVEQGIHVNCGSPDMIRQYGQLAPGREITLRINPGFGHGHHLKTNTGGERSKHGIWHEQLGECLKEATQFGLRVTGLHMHIGSGTDLQHLAQVCGAMEKAVLKAGPGIRMISAGGGLPIPYSPEQQYVDLDEYYRLWDNTRQRLQQALGHPIRLEIEPGRFLVAEAGYLISEIRAVKQQGPFTFYLVDAGFNNLARPILYGAYHPISICPADGDTNRPEIDAIVGGPLCESGDIFTQQEGGFVVTRRLPKAQVGDWLILERVGAYGFVMGSNYNSKPFAPEVLIQHGQARLVRRRQTFEDLIREEISPE